MDFTFATLVITIIVGTVIGFVASLFLGSNHGFWICCFVGVIGGFLTGWVFTVLGVNIESDILAAFITSIVGACVFIGLLKLILRDKF